MILILRAQASFEAARNAFNLSKTSNNLNAHIDMCCFYLQQSIEFFLKGIIEMFGKKYVKEHNLFPNLDIIYEIDNEFLKENSDIFEEVELRAVIFNSWEASSRYSNNFNALEKDIDKAMQICEKLNALSQKLIKYKKI